MRTNEEILKRAKERIENLEQFDSMLGLNDTQRTDLEILKELVALVEKPQWIPCSERLPEEIEGEFYPLMYLTNIYGIVQMGFYRVKDKQWYIHDEAIDEDFRVKDGYVIAWQPLPTPYKVN